MAVLSSLLVRLGVDEDGVDVGVNNATGIINRGAKQMGAAALAAGVAAGVAMGAGIVKALNIDAGRDKLAAQLGATAVESERLGNVAGELYANAYGESMDQVAQAIAGVVRNVEGLGSISNAELRDISAKVLDLAKAFQVDLGGTTRAVGKLLKTGLAADATEALDILTAGFQAGVDEAGDLLDTVGEYSTQFRKVGLSGQEMMGILTQGLQAGARDADVVADAIKEFSIRAIDGSKLTAAGFEAIGLSAGTMADKIAQGGPTAAAALDLTL